MKFREKRTGKIKHLEIERVTMVSLTNVENLYDIYSPGADEHLLEIVEATPNQRLALRRAGFKIDRAPEARTPTRNVALRRQAKRARSSAKTHAAQRASSAKQQTEVTATRRAA